MSAGTHGGPPVRPDSFYSFNNVGKFLDAQPVDVEDPDGGTDGPTAPVDDEGMGGSHTEFGTHMRQATKGTQEKEIHTENPY